MSRGGSNGVTQFSGGMIVPLFDRTHFDFGYLSNESETLNIAKALNVGFATSAVLVVRVHANNIGTSATMDLKCYPTAPSPDDPQEFSDGTADITLSIGTSDAAPKYKYTALTTAPLGAWWKVDLVATMPASVVDLSAQLSAFLVLRNG